MLQRLTLSVKLIALGSLLLPLVMVLMRKLWPDIAWGFLLLFGLQVLLLMAALQLMLTNIWAPEHRWNLPKPTPDPQRRIFAHKRDVMARLRALVDRVKSAMLSPFRRLFARKAI
jgi:uncharacterized membrane protein YagU involved in acid resistance